MAKQEWQKAEDEFETHWLQFGKLAWVHRFADAAELKGRTGAVGKVRPQPSDYLVVFDGHTSFCEVKSTTNKTSFPFSLLRTTQSAAATMVRAAGGAYYVYVKSLNSGQWYCLPYSVIMGYKELGKASIPWSDMETFKCFTPT